MFSPTTSNSTVLILVFKPERVLLIPTLEDRGEVSSPFPSARLEFSSVIVYFLKIERLRSGLDQVRQVEPLSG